MFEIVTLTGFPDIFKQFQNSVDQREPDVHRIVVTSRDTESDVHQSLTYSHRWHVTPGVEPFIFARNANIGIRLAGRSDVVLVNDDVQFTRNHSLLDLERVAYSSPDIGIVSPVVIGTVGNWLQNVNCERRDGTAYTEDRLAFVCVYIKRSIIDEIGLLDEQFDGYGGDDDDYSFRVLKAGYNLAVTTETIVRHGFGGHRSSSSFYRTHGNTGQSMADMHLKLCDKWRELK